MEALLSANEYTFFGIRDLVSYWIRETREFAPFTSDT